VSKFSSGISLNTLTCVSYQNKKFFIFYHGNQFCSVIKFYVVSQNITACFTIHNTCIICHSRIEVCLISPMTPIYCHTDDRNWKLKWQYEQAGVWLCHDKVQVSSTVPCIWLNISQAKHFLWCQYKNNVILMYSKLV